MATRFGSSGNDTLNGTIDSDLIYGGPDATGQGTGNDVVNAYGGADTVYGGDGVDGIFGNEGADSLFGGAGVDSLYGGAAADTLFGEAGTDTLAGGIGNDLLFGGADADSLDGGDDNDTLIGGAGGDRLFGGAGFDILDYSSSAGGVNVSLLSALPTGGDAAGDTIGLFEGVIGSDQNDTLTGNATANVLFGVEGDDTLTGNDGNDTLTGGAGNDSIAAGTGDDSILGGEGADTIAGGAGIDTLDHSASAAGVSVDLSGGVGTGGTAQGDVVTGVEVVLGSAQDDALTGTGAAETLVGGAGGDTLIGAGGADSLSGGDGDDVASGGAGADLVQGDAGRDTLDGGEGRDTVSGGDDADVLQGGGGDDSLSGGAGDDVLRGDAEAGTGTSGTFSWAQQGIGTNVNGGFTQTTAGMSIDFGYSSPTQTPTATITNTPQFAGTGALTNSGLQLTSTGAGPEVATLTFTSDTEGVSDAVGNVAFRINDIDADPSTYVDRVRVTAYDSDGNAVPVTLIPGGNDTLSGSTVTAGPGSDDPNQAAGTLAVTIPGPVARIEVAYDSAAGTGQRYLYLTDVSFDTQPVTPGNDTLDGGDGDDTLSGEAGTDVLLGGAGNDRITVSGTDTASGGVGDDRFVLEGPEGAASVSGGEGFDVLDFGTSIPVSLEGAGSEVVDGVTSFYGTAVFGNGATLHYEGIEQIICFTPGAMIRTLGGLRTIETLKAGDLVVTRDHGLQPIRWIGETTVSGRGTFAPIRLRKGAVPDLTADLVVSPQHRLLVEGYRAELLFGEREVLASAKHMVDDRHVTVEETDRVTYIHMLFDGHEVVYANGAATESYHPGSYGLGTICPTARAELLALFPDLATLPGSYGKTARRVLKGFETRALTG
ncbi:Hint domain-containing protein [Falsirhodobacter sp. 20TX0035]|uniref:Hint domain-containing protein n=1 Tax=Falsirhodobacter sp. 20TX0035 TaxID=3022019 RepID=UPI00232C6F21|nr:Hint domain-containing protein [Falsirhodobacter sp. 20TX0035]MDB6453348.1 Hint domain-containing protein [Falsirhodobacter sp. 20TX0035]